MPTARDYKMLIENAAVSNPNLLDLHLQFAELITDLNKRVHTLEEEVKKLKLKPSGRSKAITVCFTSPEQLLLMPPTMLAE